jgi:hypothetical protein
MAIGKVNINRGDGGIGRKPEGNEHIVGLATWKDISGGTPYPSNDWTTSDHIKLIRGISEAEDLGITSGSTDYDDLHYHLSELFRMNEEAEVWVGIFDNTAANMPDVKEVQYEADGDIYTMGVYAWQDAFATTLVDNLQTELDTLESEKQPATAYLAADFSTIPAGDMDQQTDLTTLVDQRITVVASQDGGNTGANLFSNKGYSITDLGQKLGAQSRAAVHEDIGWVGQFRVDTGTELSIPAFANGDLIKSYTSGQLDTIHSNRYCFLRKLVNYTGTFNTEAVTATDPTQTDFFDQKNNQIADKAARLLGRRFAPYINSPLYVDPGDGTLPDEQVDFLRGIALEPLDRMEEAGNISFSDVTIDPAQDVLSTQTLTIQVDLGGVGKAHNIDIPMQFTTQ